VSKLLIIAGQSNALTRNVTGNLPVKWQTTNQVQFYKNGEFSPYHPEKEDYWGAEVGWVIEWVANKDRHEGENVYIVKCAKGDRLNVAADLADIDLIRFKTGPAERDSDGVGYTAPIQTLYFRGDNPDNPITDDQLFNLHFTDQGTYYKLNSHGDPVNIYKEVMVDFSSLKVGPTEHDIMNVADNFLF